MSEDKTKMLRLLNRALRCFPNSKQQKAVLQELNELRTANGLQRIKL